MLVVPHCLADRRLRKFFWNISLNVQPLTLISIVCCSQLSVTAVHFVTALVELWFAVCTITGSAACFPSKLQLQRAALVNLGIPNNENMQDD